MKNKYLKLLLLAALAALLAISMISCGSSASAADDAEGIWGNASWEYKKDSKTLTITCAGDMPNAESPDKVNWASVRGSVEKIVFVAKDGQNISNIGDYAFYGMGNLKSVDIPESVTSIGKCAFTFCSSIENISIPTGVSAVGESAFEACSSLKAITLPGAVTTLGDRAFAFCREMTSATVAGAVENMPVSVFTDCKKLTSLTVLKNLEGFDEKAFADAGITVSYTEGLYDSTTIITYYKDTEGNELKDKKEEVKKYGDSYSIVAPEISGYTVKGANNYTGEVNGEEKIEKTFTYEKIVETEAPAETEVTVDSAEPQKEKGLTTENVIGIVILGVVIVGICVGAVMLMRSNKKQQKGNGRKNTGKRK